MDMDIKSEIRQALSKAWLEHRGRSIGIVAGLFISAFILTVGFWRTLVICFGTVLGFCIGSKIDKGESLWRTFFKILPKRFHKYF